MVEPASRSSGVFTMEPLRDNQGSEPTPVNMIEAAIRLLGDQSPVVVSAARDLLQAYGLPARRALSAAIEADCVPTRMRARALLRSFEIRDLLRAFSALDIDHSGRRGSDALLEGSVLATQMVRTFTPQVEELRRFLHGEAAVLRARFAGRSLATCAKILGEHLGESLGFHGGQARGDDLEYVLLDRVLERRVGMPVTLSLIYLLVGRMAGLSVTGVGMPEHFLVRLHGVRPLLVDPFHKGRTVTKSDCVRFLRGLGYEQTRDHLRDLSDRQVLACYLRDLRRAAGYRAGKDAHATLKDALYYLEAS
jgi:hypothetical protein